MVRDCLPMMTDLRPPVLTLQVPDGSQFASTQQWVPAPSVNRPRAARTLYVQSQGVGDQAKSQDAGSGGERSTRFGLASTAKTTMAVAGPTPWATWPARMRPRWGVLHGCITEEIQSRGKLRGSGLDRLPHELLLFLTNHLPWS